MRIGTWLASNVGRSREQPCVTDDVAEDSMRSLTGGWPRELEKLWLYMYGQIILESVGATTTVAKQSRTLTEAIEIFTMPSGEDVTLLSSISESGAWICFVIKGVGKTLELDSNSVYSCFRRRDLIELIAWLTEAPEDKGLAEDARRLHETLDRWTATVR